MPSYHLIGEEVYDLLLSGGYHVTLCSLLQRAGIDENERTQVYVDCGLESVDEQKLLTHIEMNTVRELLRNSGVYRCLVQRNSVSAYNATICYLQQEGFFRI